MLLKRYTYTCPLFSLVNRGEIGKTWSTHPAPGGVKFRTLMILRDGMRKLVVLRASIRSRSLAVPLGEVERL